MKQDARVISAVRSAKEEVIRRVSCSLLPLVECLQVQKRAIQELASIVVLFKAERYVRVLFVQLLAQLGEL